MNSTRLVDLDMHQSVMCVTACPTTRAKMIFSTFTHAQQVRVRIPVVKTVLKMQAGSSARDAMEVTVQRAGSHESTLNIQFN